MRSLIGLYEEAFEHAGALIAPCLIMLPHTLLVLS